MANDIDLATKMLKNRGVKFADPLSENDINIFNDLYKIELGEDFRNIFLKINGFLAPDSESMMMIWNLKDIEKEIKRNNFANNYFIIGDYFIDSDYIVANIKSKTANVKLLHENRHLSDSISEFIMNIAMGKFDFIKGNVKT